MNRRKIHSVLIALAMSAVLILSAQARAYDMSTNFETISSVPLAGAATDIAASGSFVYVPAGEAGLYVVDVSDPAEAQVVAVVDTPGAATAVALSANYAYLADEAGGLQLIDIGNPAAASIIGAVEGEASFTRVAATGRFAYVADAAGNLRIIDISSPRDPKELSRYTVDDKKSICGLAAQFPYVFLAFGYSDLFGKPDAAGAELSIIDVSDPLSPLRLGSLRTRHIGQDIAFSGRYAYLACADSNGSGLEIVDISEPTTPRSVGYLSFPELPKRYLHMELREELAFIAAGKFLVVDVSNPFSPHLTGMIPTPARAVDIVFSGEFVCVALEEPRCQKCPKTSFFQTWKPSNRILLPVTRVLAEPEPERREIETVRYINTSSAVALSKNRLCFAVGSAKESKLQVIDLSDSKYPPASGECVLDGEAGDIAIWKNFALVAADGLIFADISDAAKPAAVKTVDAIKRAYAVEVLESYAYVVDGTGLKVIELKSPAEAAIVGALETPYSARDVAVSKDFAYIADGAGLQIVDITDKRVPKPAGSFSYEWAMATRVAAEGNVVCLGDKAGFVTFIDASDPNNPKLLGKKQLPGPPGAMSISGGRLFVPVSADKIVLLSLDITHPTNSPFRSVRDFIAAMTRRRAILPSQTSEVSESWGSEGSAFKGGAVAVSDSKIYVTDLERGLLTGPLKASVPAGALKVEQQELAVSYELEMDAPPLRLEIANAGPGAARYAVSSDADWLSFNPCTGDLQENEHGLIEVSLVPSALREGAHTAKIFVAEEYGKLLQVIPLSLQVLPCRYPPIHIQPNWYHLKDVQPGQVEKLVLSSEKPFKVFEASASYPWIQVEIDSQESSLQHVLTVTIAGRGKPGRNYGVFKIQTDNPIYKNFNHSFSITFAD